MISTFGPISKSLSQSDAKTMRPTKVRASVGSSASASSAMPMSSVASAAGGMPSTYRPRRNPAYFAHSKNTMAWSFLLDFFDMRHWALGTAHIMNTRRERAPMPEPYLFKPAASFALPHGVPNHASSGPCSS
jgi:hypothetical protein